LNSPSDSLWGDVDLPPGSTRVHELGDLKLELRREPEEIWVRADIEGMPPSRQPDWTRWSVAAGQRLELSPSLPDRPIVVSPEQPFFLPPDATAHVYVRVPIFVRLSRVDSASRRTHFEIFPSVVMSDTWWGGFTEGVLAYWVGTRARRLVDPEVFEPHFAVCPFVLVNESAAPLPVERFAVRVSYLTLFGQGRAVWTDEVLVRYEGLLEGSEIRYTGRVPSVAGDVDKIADPVQAAPRGFRAKTFGRLLSLTSGV